MELKESAKERVLLYCIYGLFAIYIVVLLRITLFKQVSLYNLFAAIGASERTINVIPFRSIFEMANTNISMMRILENVLGNIVIFIPLGMLLPIILKRDSRSIWLAGLLLSAFIEIVQFCFGLGSSDIDDLLFNTIGTISGYMLFKTVRKHAKSSLSFLATMVAVVTISGMLAFTVLFVTHNNLFMISPKKITVENVELVQSFIDTPFDSSGKLVAITNSVLTLEKSVQSASEQRKLAEFNLTADSRIYICYYKIDYFLDSIKGEHKRYEKISYADFIAQNSELHGSGNKHVNVWSADGSNIDNIVIIEWIE